MKNLIYLVVMVAATSCASSKTASNNPGFDAKAQNNQNGQMAHIQVKDEAAARNVAIHSLRH